MPDDDLMRALSRHDLPAGFRRWRVTLAPGEQRATTRDEWADTVVVVESGALGVECAAGSRRRFPAGAVLALEWVAVQVLHGAAAEPTSLLAVRRETGCHTPTVRYLP